MPRLMKCLTLWGHSQHIFQIIVLSAKLPNPIVGDTGGGRFAAAIAAWLDGWHLPDIPGAASKSAPKCSAEMRSVNEAVLIGNLGNAAAIPWIGQDRVNALKSSPLNKCGHPAEWLACRIECRTGYAQSFADGFRRKSGGT